MSVGAIAEILTAAIFRPRDLRDPLGVWGGRAGLTGNGTGGQLSVQFNAPDDNAGAYVYTCHSANAGQLTGILASTGVKLRLLTNWPNIDPQPGVQGYNAVHMGVTRTQDEATGQRSAPTNTTLFEIPNMKTILLFDPRPSAGAITLVEIEWNENTDLATYVFECYGYYWDRQVMNIPGGLRHPGSD